MVCRCGGDLAHGWHDTACVEHQVEDARVQSLRAALEAAEELMSRDWSGTGLSPGRFIVQAIERLIEEMEGGAEEDRE